MITLGTQIVGTSLTIAHWMAWHIDMGHCLDQGRMHSRWPHIHWCCRWNFSNNCFKGEPRLTIYIQCHVGRIHQTEEGFAPVQAQHSMWGETRDGSRLMVSMRREAVKIEEEAWPVMNWPSWSCVSHLLCGGFFRTSAEQLVCVHPIPHVHAPSGHLAASSWQVLQAWLWHAGRMTWHHHNNETQKEKYSHHWRWGGALATRGASPGYGSHLVVDGSLHSWCHVITHTPLFWSFKHFTMSRDFTLDEVCICIFRWDSISVSRCPPELSPLWGAERYSYHSCCIVTLLKPRWRLMDLHAQFILVASTDLYRNWCLSFPPFPPWNVPVLLLIW